MRSAQSRIRCGSGVFGGDAEHRRAPKSPKQVLWGPWRSMARPTISSMTARRAFWPQGDHRSPAECGEWSFCTLPVLFGTGSMRQPLVSPLRFAAQYSVQFMGLSLRGQSRTWTSTRSKHSGTTEHGETWHEHEMPSDGDNECSSGTWCRRPRVPEAIQNFSAHSN